MWKVQLSPLERGALSVHRSLILRVPRRLVARDHYDKGARRLIIACTLAGDVIGEGREGSSLPTR
jgi:hypothetical protein